MAKSGKCDDCRRSYQWPLDVPLGNAGCPQCKRLLKRTILTRQGEPHGYPVYNVTNSDVELHPMVRRPRRERKSVADLFNPKVGPGTD